MKRTLDCIIALGTLIIFSPLFALIYILIKAEDGSPVIFKQERIGRKGKPFNILKFRSMTVDANRDENELFSLEQNDNLTRVGKFLRDHHLDELPQLWNVFVGDMAFVGPRPERKYYIDKIMERDPRYEQLYKLRPGVTSYATLYNGYTDTLEKMLVRLEMDLYYLEHQSLWFDAKILMKTFVSIITGKKFPYVFLLLYAHHMSCSFSTFSRSW